jgi:hypothetical protein
MPHPAVTASSKMLPVIKFTEELPNIKKEYRISNIKRNLDTI